MSGSRLPEMSDDDLGELPDIACTQKRALASARTGRFRKSEWKRVTRDQARAHQYQTSQHVENAPALAGRTQRFHTADVFETKSLCTAVTTTSATEKIVFMHMLHATNAACCFWKSLMHQEGSEDENNTKSCRSLRDNTQMTSATDVWITSLSLGTNWIGGAGGNEIPLPQRPQKRGRGGAMGGARMQRQPINHMDIDQVSITTDGRARRNSGSVGAARAPIVG
jgi:hypothetical protein